MKAIYTLFLLLFSSVVFSNNIQLQKVSLSDTNRAAKTVNIKMNISWEHSWRDSINWDAAWIIIKYKEPKDSAWKWKQASLSQAGNDIGTGAASMKIVVPNDLMGAFFYRSSISSGNVSNENVKLFWNYGAAGVTNIDSVEVRVFATEMVYVPEGSFCLGDGNGTSKSTNAFQLKTAANNYAVINDKWSPLINTLYASSGFSNGDDAVIGTDGIRISGSNGLDIDNDKVADYPDFPTGYRGFYCMKYKVTQGQYTDFLNTVCVNDTTASVLQFAQVTSDPNFLKKIPKPLQAAWAPLGDFAVIFFSSDKKRHSISFDSVQTKFTVSRPDRAYALMDLKKGCSFSEWFGLRPMSELEFEKSCRGPLPPYYSYPYRLDKAWGADTAYPIANIGVSLTLSGAENGTETFSDYNVSKRLSDPTNSNSPIIGGDGGLGPYRVGIYANDTSSRVSSGSSYYGIMDLSKITSEIVIPLSTSTHRGFTYANGKGVLSPFGNSYTFANVAGYTVQTIYRFSSVSGRNNTQSYYGFRAVRSAPSDN